MTGGRSCTRSSPDSRRSTGCLCCSATWRVRPTPRPRRSSVRRGHGPAAAQRRPRLAAVPIVPARGRADGRGPRRDPRPLGAREGPPGWVEASVRAAAAFASHAGRIAVGDMVSTAVAKLARKSLRTMLLSQLKAVAAAAVFLIALVGVAWRVGLAGQGKAGPAGGRGCKVLERRPPHPRPGGRRASRPNPGRRRLSGPGPRPGRASPSRGRRCTW